MTLFERFFFSADLGDGSGGVDGGAAVADAGADAGVDASPEGGQPEATPFDYEGFAKPLGGPEGLQRAIQFANDIQNRAHYNPQFREVLEKALRGEYGPAAQQDAQAKTQGGQPQQQQQGQGEAWLKYDPGTLSQMQTFHRLLEQAKNSGDPQAVKDVWDDPQNAQAREAFLKHQNEMNSAWWDQRGHFQKLWNDPELQQMRQQEYQQMVQQAVQPLQEELWNYQKMNFYQQNQKAIDSLPQHIKDAFGRGVFGDYSTGTGWIKAAQAAMQEAQRIAGGGQSKPAEGAVAPNETEPAPKPAQRPATNGVNRMNQPAEKRDDPYKKFAQDYVKARQKDEASKKS